MKYKNPVFGTKFEYGNLPEFLTREEVISMAADSMIGTCKHIPSGIDSFLDWMRSEGSEIDFCFDDFTLDELRTVDSIVEVCEHCGWNCAPCECDCDGSYEKEEEEDLIF